MSDFISKRELYHKLGEAYQKGYLSWGANEVIKDIIGECDSVENKGDLISRQAILDRTVNRNSIWNKITDSEGNNLEDILNSIPSTENKGEWIYDKSIYNWRCSKCGETPPPTGYVGKAEFMATHFKFCNHCGADMRKSEKPETCKGCLEPCIMYEPDMRACKKKVTERGETDGK